MIRPARKHELALLPAIEDSAAEVFDKLGYALDEGAVTAPAEQWNAPHEAGLLWVYEGDDGAPVAFLAAHIHEDVFYVGEVDVHLSHQHKGIGRALMAHARAEAETRGLAWMALTTFTHVPWNAPFYQSLGFEIVREPPRWLAHILHLESVAGLTNRCGMMLKLA